MKLTLERTWTECLRLWKWVKEQIEAGSKKTVWELKEEWMKRNNYSDIAQCNCFFCHYDARNEMNCDFCPGRLVDKTFDCENKSYAWHDKPIAFYKKLLELNRKRKKAKK